jgi:hypothetical protein
MSGWSKHNNARAAAVAVGWNRWRGGRLIGKGGSFGKMNSNEGPRKLQPASGSKDN